MTPSESYSYKKTVLDNGVTVLSEKIDTVRSIAVGVWVKIGSRSERPVQNGTAHFLEHMIFKGTKKRSPLKIAQSMESLGGSINAFTGKEVTCYFANALDIHLKNAVEVLSDIVCNSTFPDKEISREKMVILEEIKSVKDTPEDFVFDLFNEKLFPGCSLGRPILGTESIIEAMTRERVFAYWQDHYRNGNIVVSAAGNLDHEELLKYVSKYFHLNSNTVTRYTDKCKRADAQVHVLEQPINQAHICLGGDAIPYTSDERFPLMVLNTYLGGGMSSRLFQQLREKRGLAYSIYSFLDFYSDIGMFGVYIGTDVQKIDLVQNILHEELERLSDTPLTKKTLQTIKNQLKGNLLLGLESTSRRMSRLAKNEIYFGENVTLDQLVSCIDGVEVEDTLEVARQYIQHKNFTTVILKPINK
ncbi:MAG: insulinase family protein [Calditrichales bacterium]|nr:MAG: insulinase family protein [Calditrichales bacterium]